MVSQLLVLNKILQNKDMSIITLNNLSEDYFSDYKNEFNFIKRHYETYGNVPDRITFSNTFPDFDIADVSEPDSYLIEQLITDYNQGYLATCFNNIKKLLVADKTADAIELFKGAVDNLHTGAALRSTDILKDFSRYDHYVERTQNRSKYYISTGFPELDRFISGIDRENENMVIIARTGVGKSWTLLKMAASASKQGMTVGIYSGEMSVDKVGYRLDTLMGGIDNAAITHGNPFAERDYKKYLNDIQRTNWGAIKVVTPNDINGPATVDALKAFIRKEHLDILFIDQYSLLEDSSHAKSEHEKIANISKAIKNLQVMERIPIVSVSQQNRTKNEDGTIDTTMVFGSDRIGQDATVLIAIDKKDDEMNYYILKSRDGGDNKKLTYRIDLNVGEFTYIPNAYDSTTSREEIDKLNDSYMTDNDEG